MNSTSWLTPMLVGAALMLLLYIAGQQNSLAAKVDKALLKLGVHETIFIQRGMMSPIIKGGP